MRARVAGSMWATPFGSKLALRAIIAQNWKKATLAATAGINQLKAEFLAGSLL
jgi:hypothetical protein